MASFLIQSGTERASSADSREQSARFRPANHSSPGSTLPAPDLPSPIAGGGVFPYLVTGMHFGILQASLFFAAQVYVTATFLGYFVVVMAWMVGTIASMRTGFPRTLPTALAISAAAYLGLLVLGSNLVPNGWLTPLYFLLASVSAFPAGTFFRVFSQPTANGVPAVSVRSLLLHENNGFIIGLLVGMFGFVKWGVNFLAVGPLLSLGGALFVFTHPAICLLVFLPGVAYLCHRLGNDWAAWTVCFAGVLGGICWFIPARRHPAAGKNRGNGFREAGIGNKPPMTGNGKSEPLPLPRLLLALAGGNLILLQYFITREFSSILAASELAILVVAVAYFTGFSVGYFVSRSIPAASLRWGAAGMFLLHLAILMCIKVVAGMLIHAGYGMTTLVTLLFLAAFCTSSLYSVLLPRLIDSANLPLITGYAWDLCGAIAGTVFMLFLVPYAPWLLWPTYFAILLVIILVMHRHSPWQPALGVAGLGLLVVLFMVQEPVQRYAAEDYYRTRSDAYSNPKIVFQGNSFYHAIEVIDTFRDVEQRKPKSRISFINGVRYFRHYDASPGVTGREAPLSEFTYFLAELPAKILHEKLDRPLRVLIMGGGSLSTINRVASYAGRTTLVEIDPLVVESSKQCWSALNRWWEVTNAEIVIDDAFHYLRTTDETFDLIINDISAPYYLGTAMMHGKELYELVRNRLKPEGLFSESTQSRPRPSRPDSSAMKILRGVAEVFDHWRVVDCKGAPRGRRGYVYATVDGPLSTNELTSTMKRDDKYASTSTYWEGTSHFPLYRVTPFSLENMETLLSSNVKRITKRLRIDSRNDDKKDLRVRSSLFSVIREAFDETNPDHSRLFVRATHILHIPRFLVPALLVVFVAMMTRWFVPRSADRNGRSLISCSPRVAGGKRPQSSKQP